MKSPQDPRRILFPVRVPEIIGSVRFRLTVIYSLVLFGLAALVVLGIYLGLRASLDDPVTHRVQPIFEGPDGFVITSDILEVEMRSFEEAVDEQTLEMLRNYSFASLGILFVASLGIGWIVAGRALAPIDRITVVARQIQATNLKRRISLGGPHDELRELADTFDSMLGRIDEAFEGQRRFIHEASHELRNPLAVIKTNLEVTLADPDASTQDLRETAEVVSGAADRMGRLVDDLLLYARREVPSMEMVPVDAAEVVAMAAAEFRRPAEDRDLELVTAAEPGLWVFGDRVALRQALANLQANAIRLAPAGTRIRVAAGRAPEAGWIWLAVEDQGPGISKEDQEKVFERFWRGDKRASRKEGRSGLGLAIVQQIASAHHGEARLASERGKGSTFSIWLPEYKPHPSEITGEHPSSTATSASSTEEARTSDHALDTGNPTKTPLSTRADGKEA